MPEDTKIPLSARHRLDFRNEGMAPPTDEMWMAMRSASHIVDMSSGGHDPTVRRLEQWAAEATGQEAAYFLPTTTAGTLVALLAIGVRAKKIVMEARCHLWWVQQFHGAVFAGGIPVALPGDNFGAIPLDALQNELCRSAFGTTIGTAVVCLENTHNICGGTTLSGDYTRAVADVCREHDARLFIDGARIFNAAVASNLPISALANPADAIVISLNKALGAPYGALLCANGDLIEGARVEAQRIGANQVHKCGIFAAAALAGLEGLEDRIRDDHSRAHTLARAVAKTGIVSLDLDTVQTNLVRVETLPSGLDSVELARRLAAHGLGVEILEPGAIRLAVHSGVTEDDIGQAIAVFETVASELASA